MPSLNTILATAPLTATGYHLKATGTALGQSLIWDNGTNVGIGNTNTSYTLDVSGTLRNTTSAYFATASGSVGIGTVSPSDKFSVDAGAGNVVTSSFFNSTMTAGQSSYIEIGKNYSSTYNTGELAFKYVGDGSSSNIVSLGFYGAGNKLNVLGNGNVGIAVTPSSWSSSFKALQVGTASLSQNNNTTAYIGSNWVSESGGDKYITTNAAAIYAQNTGAHIWYSAPSGTAGDAMTFTETMRIASNGQVQITQGGNGYTTGGLRLTNTASQYWSIVNGGNNKLYLGYNNNDAGEFSNSTGVYTPLSDINKKKDFEDSTIGLNAILGLKPTLYRMKSEDETSDKHLGFIAQEVKEFIPQAYVESINDENTFIGLDYQAITSALVKAVQEQNQTIQNLQEQINILAK